MAAVGREIGVAGEVLHVTERHASIQEYRRVAWDIPRHAEGTR
jgi:hypothetical protein